MNKKLFFIGIGLSILCYFFAGFISGVTAVLLGEFTLFLLAGSAATSTLLGTIVFSLPFIILFFALNRACLLFSSDSDYRKGLRWGLLLAIVPIATNFYFSNKINNATRDMNLSYEITDERECAKLEGLDDRTRNYTRATCYSRIAESKKDFRLCDKIEGTDDSVLATKSHCYQEVGRLAVDPSICKKVLYKSDWDWCLAGIAIEAQRPELCHGIENLSTKGRCYAVAIQKTKDPLVVQRFCPFTTLNKAFEDDCVKLWGAESIKTNNLSRDEVDHMKENLERVFIELSKS